MRYAVEDIAIETRTPIMRIGRIVAGRGVRALRADGSEWLAPTAGFVHFA
jgi:thiamine-monophosphate kinase